MIRVSMDWQGKKGLDNLIRYIENNLIYGEAQDLVYDLAYKTATDMKNIISNERKNPKRTDDALVNNIEAEPINTVGGVEMGIGNIARLKLLAPHWELINDGGIYITKETHVVPTTYMGYEPEEFVTFKAGSSHIITGIDYIGQAIRNLDNELKRALENIGEKFIKGMNK